MDRGILLMVLFLHDFYLLAEMMISCIAPVYGIDDEFIGVAEIALTLYKTNVLVEDLVTTPGGSCNS